MVLVIIKQKDSIKIITHTILETICQRTFTVEDLVHALEIDVIDTFVVVKILHGQSRLK